MIIAATGHRPDKLGGYDDTVFSVLKLLALNHLSKLNPEKVISGMALGWDQAFADAALTLRIPYIAAIPFVGQSVRWPPVVRKKYDMLVEGAAEKVIVTLGEVPSIDRAFQDRNKWMVDRADKMLALWSGSKGGTLNCIRYAEKQGVPVENLWDEWKAMTLSKIP